MIFGIGTDIVQIERVAGVYDRFRERFANRLLMPEELKHFNRTRQPARFLAMRFAAKEAIVKAMGTGFAHGIWIRDTGMVPDKRGKPEVIFSERGRFVCEKLGIGAAHLSLADEAGVVVAFAVLEKA